MIRLAEGVLFAVDRLRHECIDTTARLLHEVMYFALPSDFRDEHFVPAKSGPYCESIQQIILALDAEGFIKYDDKSDLVSTTMDFQFDKKKDLIKSRIGKFVVLLKKNSCLDAEKIAIVSRYLMISSANKDATNRGIIWKIYDSKAPFLGWETVTSSKKKRLITEDLIMSLSR